MEAINRWTPEQVAADWDWDEPTGLPSVAQSTRRMTRAQIHERIGVCYRAMAAVQLSMKAVGAVETRGRSPEFFRLSDSMLKRCQREMRWLQSLL